MHDGHIDVLDSATKAVSQRDSLVSAITIVPVKRSLGYSSIQSFFVVGLDQVICVKNATSDGRFIITERQNMDHDISSTSIRNMANVS